MTQKAPYPTDLERLVGRLRYKDGWRFRLTHKDRGHGAEGLTLRIIFQTRNSYEPRETLSIEGIFPVPAVVWSKDTWQRWLLGQIELMEQHETWENFVIDGKRPYAPDHSSTGNAYIFRETLTHEQVEARKAIEKAAMAQNKISPEEEILQRRLRDG